MHFSRMRTAHSLTVFHVVSRVGSSSWGGVCPARGVCLEGISPGRGFLPREGVSAQGGGFLPGGVCPAGGVCLGSVCLWGVCSGGVPCDLSHHAFDVTRILFLLQLRLKSNAAAYIVLVM